MHERDRRPRGLHDLRRRMTTQPCQAPDTVDARLPAARGATSWTVGCRGGPPPLTALHQEGMVRAPAVWWDPPMPDRARSNGVRERRAGAPVPSRACHQAGIRPPEAPSVHRGTAQVTVGCRRGGQLRDGVGSHGPRRQSPESRHYIPLVKYVRGCHERAPTSRAVRRLRPCYLALGHTPQAWARLALLLLPGDLLTEHHEPLISFLHKTHSAADPASGPRG